MHHKTRWTLAIIAGAAIGVLGTVPTQTAHAEPEAKATASKKKPDFPKMSKVVTDDFEKVISTADGKSMWEVYVNNKTGQVVAKLPRGYDKTKYFLAPTMAEGVPSAQSSMIDGYMITWKKIGKRMALIQPNLNVRSSGDKESKLSRDMQFTDRIVTDMPIIAMDGSSPVIDLTDLFVKNGRALFPFLPRLNANLVEVATAKAFPSNIEIAFRAPSTNGTLVTMHYSLSELPEKTGYKPREADYRVGYFTTWYTDLNSIGDSDLTTRYINRFHLEKADPDLELSPPKEPIVYYIEHTTPIKYRNAVREGILEWNKAFEHVGIVNAIEVYQQDARTGAHMEKDPEDVRYNFSRWSTNNTGFAIGPLRADPRTGQVLDADILMNDGWLRGAVNRWDKVLSSMAIETMSPETLAWLDANPDWDPRIQLASPTERTRLMTERQRMLETTGPRPHGGHPIMEAFERDAKSREVGGLWSYTNAHVFQSLCSHTMHKAFDMDLATHGLIDFEGINMRDGDLDGVPDEFVNAMIKDVIMHEIGHILGLRHNFSASTIYDIEEINSKDMIGKAITGSVMDYNATNYNHERGEVQGEYFMPTVGPYDIWAVKYGYETDKKKLEDILAEAPTPELIYQTDENLAGPDPTARQRDMGRNTLDFIEMERGLIDEYRSKILDRAVEEGDSWGKVRSSYQSVLFQQFRNVQTAANWLGGTFTYRDRVGTTDRDPLKPVSADDQRRALRLLIDMAFKDESYGLDPNLLTKMSNDRWIDQGRAAFMTDETYNIHDTILGIQNVAIMFAMNPTTLRRVYDNEFVIDSDEDALTLAEMMSTVSNSVWSELDEKDHARHSARNPMISSLRRNLQSTHVDLLKLLVTDAMPGAASKPISDLALWHLEMLSQQIDNTIEEGNSSLDPYTLSHLNNTKKKIDATLEAISISS
ncbi:MAG: zinc-dependent metalloprotease [Phycisphaerales bacterium JB043]